MHVWDLDLFSVDEFIHSKHVIEFLLDAFGTKLLAACITLSFRCGALFNSGAVGANDARILQAHWDSNTTPEFH